MDITVIIVNYNVKYFLEQCLQSVQKALQGISSEIIVVDNNSVDGSVKMIKEKFPDIELIANNANTGFSKANNQAIHIAKGNYILLLNPDTVVEDDTFSKIIAFMNEHPEAGGLGVKMLDGKGNFLPESKRGLPTPAAAFYKIFGLAKLFPKSRKFGKYHLGFLDKDKIHEVEILSGAFFLIRKEVIEKTGTLDEAFFMYGEDIDLSYRIIKAGYKNYYFPETRIIHYKGESTRKSSINYVVVFYNAMLIFAKKHFSKENARSFSTLIHFAIYLRAFVALLARFFKQIIVPLLDVVVTFAGIFVIKNYWEQNVIFHDGGSYPPEFISIAVPIYIFIWLITVYFAGGYDKPIRLSRIAVGIFFGSLITLTFYGLLSESYRFSRALILLGAAWSLISMLSIRFTFHLMKIRGFQLVSSISKRFAIIGSQEETDRVSSLLKQTIINPSYIATVSLNAENNSIATDFVGTLNQIKEIISIYKINEVVFCAKNMSAQEIISQMTELQSLQVDFKIAPPESMYIIGSNSINTAGDLYIINVNSISKYSNKRNKRVLDIILAIILLCIFPITFFFARNPIQYFANIFSVLIGFQSWIGYHDVESIQTLPKIRKGILFPSDAIKNKIVNTDLIKKMDMLYAREYKPFNDINIILKGFRNIGRK